MISEARTKIRLRRVRHEMPFGLHLRTTDFPPVDMPEELSDDTAFASMSVLGDSLCARQIDGRVIRVLIPERTTGPEGRLIIMKLGIGAGSRIKRFVIGVKFSRKTNRSR